LNPHSAKHRRILRAQIQVRWSAANYAGVRPTRGRRIFNYAQLRSSTPECARLPSQGRHKAQFGSNGTLDALPSNEGHGVSLRHVQIVKQRVSYEEEILRDYEAEHCGFEGYEIGLDYLRAANTHWQGRWSLVLLSAADIANVMLPLHHHGIEVIPQSGLSVSAAVQRVRWLPKEQMPKCWDRISKIKDRDFSQMRICLASEEGVLKHVDGVHRLLAYGLFNKNEELSAYVAGL
jgi:hypothetical protein